MRLWPFKPKAVLLIDDDPMVARIIAARFRRAPSPPALVTAQTAGDGLRAAHETTPRRILLDWMLPDGDGVSLLKRLRADPAFTATQICMLTARGAMGDVDEALKAGANGYFIKPCELDSIWSWASA